VSLRAMVIKSTLTALLASSFCKVEMMLRTVAALSRSLEVHIVSSVECSTDDVKAGDTSTRRSVVGRSKTGSDVDTGERDGDDRIGCATNRL